jgi:hypothetical protein
MSNLKELVAKLQLESPRIYVGQHRIYPTRAGFEVPQSALEQLQLAIENPSQLTSAVRISDGDQLVFHGTARGEVKQSMLTNIEPEVAKATITSPEVNVPQPEAWHHPQSAQNDYLNLAGVSPLTSIEDLKGQFTLNPQAGVEHDQKVYQSALRQQISPEHLIYTISQGPMVQSLVDRDMPISETTGYIAPMMSRYIEDSQNVLTQTENSDKSAFQLNLGQPNEYSQKLVQSIATHTQEIQSLAQQHLQTFQDKSVEPYWKQWAAQQLPKLRDYVVQSAQEKGPRLKHWLKEQGPLLGAAILTSKATKGASLKAWGASQAPKVNKELESFAVETKKSLGTAGKAIHDLASHSGQELAERGLHLVQDLATPKPNGEVTDDQIAQGAREVIALWGKDGHLDGWVFNFHDDPQKGVTIHLKDGTPAFTDGKLNTGLNQKYLQRIRRIPSHVAQVKQQIASMKSNMPSPSHRQDSISANNGVSR